MLTLRREVGGPAAEVGPRGSQHWVTAAQHSTAPASHEQGLRAQDQGQGDSPRGLLLTPVYQSPSDGNLCGPHKALVFLAAPYVRTLSLPPYSEPPSSCLLRPCRASNTTTY